MDIANEGRKNMSTYFSTESVTIFSGRYIFWGTINKKMRGYVESYLFLEVKIFPKTLNFFWVTKS